MTVRGIQKTLGFVPQPNLAGCEQSSQPFPSTAGKRSYIKVKFKNILSNVQL